MTYLYRAPAGVVLLDGLSYRQLDNWCSKKWVEADTWRGQQGGPGSQRLFSERSIDRIAAIVALVGAGISPSVAARAVDNDGWLDETVRLTWTPQGWRSRLPESAADHGEMTAFLLTEREVAS